MNIFRKLGGLVKGRNNTDTVTSQTRESYSHPFTAINQYIPLKAQLELYKVMREAIPILDTAIYKIDRLKGSFKVIIKDNEKIQAEINEFLDNVKVNAKEKGYFSFLSNYFTQALEGGTTYGEIIINGAKDDIYALKNIDASRMRLKPTDNPLEILICEQRYGSIEPVVLPYQNLLLFTALNPEEDNPYGVSLFRSLPFVTDILLKILNSIGINWDRFGNVRYSVTYKPDKDNLTPSQAEERAKQIQKNFSSTISEGKKGIIKDFFGIGDIQIKVIGADNQILDCEIPVKVLLEQLVAKTGLPPFLLGLAWSTTERMSSQQADLLTSELEAYRKLLEPPSRQVIDLWLQLKGYKVKYELEWDDINLQDAVELARAEYFRQQAEEKKIGNVIRKRNENIIDQQTAAEELGYEKPVGNAPSPADNQLASENKTLKKKYMELLKCFDSKEFKDLESNPHPDPKVQELQVEFTAAFMSRIKEAEKKLFEIAGIDPELAKTYYIPKGLPDDWERAQEVIRNLGEAIKNVYSAYLYRSWSYGTRRANQAARQEIPSQEAEDEDINIPEEPVNEYYYEHPYVREIRENGLETLSDKLADIKEKIRSLFMDGASRGENPSVWARRLHDELGGQRWYWERLARSESAIALDRADTAEYKSMNIPYEEWSAAPDACRQICAPLNGRMWPIGTGPQVVYDTHPHCRCRKLPRTKRQYERYLANRPNSGIITGGKTADEELKEYEKAERYYEKIRNGNNDDILKISQNTGWNQRSLQKVKEHIFINEYELREGKRRFDADPRIAKAWKRLILGVHIRESDVVLLKHEYLEQYYMHNKGMDYDSAHTKANEKHNWHKLIELEDW